MMKHIKLKPWLRTLLALSAVMAAPSTHAASPLPDCSVDEKGRSACLQPFSEGLAAVLTPVIGHSDGRWGFIDTRGNMVIKPGYDQVRPFAKGLAAAQRTGRWGYIDTQGVWVIEPLFDQASDFGDTGTALVTRAGELLRINRSGQTHSVLPATQRAVLHDPVDNASQRWSVSIEPHAQLWDVQQGRIVPLPVGLSNVAPPQDGLIPAEKRLPSGAIYWGLMNQEGTWAMAPQVLQSDDRPWHDQGLVARQTRNRWQFVNLQGIVQHAGTLQEVRLVCPGSWVVAPEEGQLELWDAKATRVMALPSGLSLYHPSKLGDSVVLESRDHVALVAPQGRAWQWDTTNRRMQTTRKLLWLLRDEESDAQERKSPNEIIRPDGQPFLDADTRARLDDYQVKPVGPDQVRFSDPDAAPIALALLKPLDKGRPPALLTLDGHIVSDPTWLHIRPRHDSQDPWVVQTQDGLFGAIDGQGHWIIAPTWLGLDDFSHGVTMGRRADIDGGRQRVLLDKAGQRLSAPPEITQDCTHWLGAVLACVNDRGAELRHYLWHPVRQQRTDMAPLRHFNRLPYGLYSVEQGKQWGILDSQGAWRISPQLADAEDLSLLDQEVGLETMHDAPGLPGKRYRLINLKNGQPISAPHVQEPEALGIDRYRVQTEHEGSRVINASGTVLLSQPWPTSTTRVEGQWTAVLFSDIWGVMDLLGQWHVPPRYRSVSRSTDAGQWLSVQTPSGFDMSLDAEGHPMEGDPAAPPPRTETVSATQGPQLRLVQRGQRQAFINAQGQAVITVEARAQQQLVRNAQGQQTWPSRKVASP